MNSKSKEYQLMEKDNVTEISDQFIKRIYDSGNWSKISFFILVVMLQINGSFVIFSATFTAASVNFQCNDNSSLFILRNNSCNMFNSETNHSVGCSNNYTFFPDENFMSSSIVSHFQLVCDRSHLDEISQSLVIVGLVIGGFIGPITGDYFGRQKVMLISIFSCGIVGISIAFAPYFIYFAIGKCLLGILREISMTNGFVLALELIPSYKQSLFGMLNQIVWSFSLLFIGLLAFFFRNWQHLQVVGSFPSLLAPILIIVIPESPRWLISKGKIIELEIMIKRYVEKWNNAKINDFDHLLKKLKTNNDTLLYKVETKTPRKYNALDIFHSKYLVFWTFILTLTWIYGVTASYSLTGMTTLTAGNPFLNYSISAMLDAVGVVIAFFIMKKSRNIAVLSFQILSSVTYLTAGFLPNSLKYLTTCLILIGKLALNGNLFVISISALYIYPSSLRIFGSTISCTLGKLVSISSPYLIEQFKVHMWLPTTIFGVFALLVGILNIFFPDWLNKPMPETMEDVEKLKRNIFFPCCIKEEKSDKMNISLSF